MRNATMAPTKTMAIVTRVCWREEKKGLVVNMSQRPSHMRDSSRVVTDMTGVSSSSISRGPPRDPAAPSTVSGRHT
jgi:hypothetical protein